MKTEKQLPSKYYWWYFWFGNNTIPELNEIIQRAYRDGNQEKVRALSVVVAVKLNHII